MGKGSPERLLKLPLWQKGCCSLCGKQVEGLQPRSKDNRVFRSWPRKTPVVTTCWRTLHVGETHNPIPRPRNATNDRTPLDLSNEIDHGFCSRYPVMPQKPGNHVWIFLQGVANVRKKQVLQKACIQEASRPGVSHATPGFE